MQIHKTGYFILFLGDIFFFVASLLAMLIVRYQSHLTRTILVDHLFAFAILFIVWFFVFYIAGLYERRIVIFSKNLPKVLFNAQIVNTIIAIIFFYFIPYFGITPKTNLFIYLVFSFFSILVWRFYGYTLFGPRRRQNAILISSGAEMRELREEVNSTDVYNLRFISSVDLERVESIDFQEEIIKRIYAEDVSVIALDFKNPHSSYILANLYNLIFSRIIFIDMHKVYEDIFDRIPLSLITYGWVLENISLMPKVTYDFLKRLMDVLLSLILGVISLLLYPFVFMAIKLDDGGPIFFLQ